MPKFKVKTEKFGGDLKVHYVTALTKTGAKRKAKSERNARRRDVTVVKAKRVN